MCLITLHCGLGLHSVLQCLIGLHGLHGRCGFLWDEDEDDEDDDFDFDECDDDFDFDERDDDLKKLDDEEWWE